jgi:threonine aldolase
MNLEFSSENFDKTHTAVLKALIKSNKGLAPSYGKDAITLESINLFKQIFGTKEIEVFFCFNGTGANNFALSSITEKKAPFYVQMYLTFTQPNPLHPKLLPVAGFILLRLLMAK